VSSAVSILTLFLKQPVPSLPLLCTLNLTTVTVLQVQFPKSHINRLQQIQNCLARTAVKAPKFFHITAILRSLYWLKINECIERKLLSLTYKVLTTSQPDYLHNLISVQSTCRTHSSSVVTLARPSVSSSLQIINHSFRYITLPVESAPSSYRQPHSVHSPPGSSHPVHITQGCRSRF